MRSAAACFFLFLVASRGLAVSPITTAFDQSTIRPGGLVTFTTALDSPTSARFTVEIPRSPLLELVTEETGTLRLEQDRFRQTHRWIFQAVTSGTVRLDPLKATLNDATGSHPVPLPAAELTIAPFATTDISSSPLPLPTPVPPTTAGPRWILLLPGVLIVGAVLFILVARQKRRVRP